MRPDYSDEFEAFSEALAREWHLHRSGQKPHLDLEPVYGRYADLFRPEEIAELRSESETAYLERDRKAYRYLLAAAVEHHAAALARPLTEEIEGHDARATVTWDGHAVPMRAVPVLLANEPRADARNELASRAERLVAETNDLRAERLERLTSAAEALGTASWGALRAGLEGVDYERLASSATRLLTSTERLYTESLADAMAAGPGVRIASATHADAMRLFRLAAYDRFFPPSRLGVVLRDTLTGLGIRPGAQTNVSLDLADRPLKEVAPSCARVRIPGRVVLVARPVGGYLDYVSVLGVTGCGQQAAFTSPETRPAFTRAGDRAAPGAWARLFRNLLVDPDWIADLVGADASYRASAALHRCYLVRRDAGLAVYEEGLHAGRTSLAAAPTAFEETLDEATRVANGRAAYLRTAGAFRGADALRAWALEVLLRDRLKTRFGRRWWTSRAAGDLLKEIWSTGNEYSCDDLAAELELGAISLDALEADLLGGIAA